MCFGEKMGKIIDCWTIIKEISVVIKDALKWIFTALGYTIIIITSILSACYDECSEKWGNMESKSKKVIKIVFIVTFIIICMIIGFINIDI